MVAARRVGLSVSYGGSHGTGRFADIVRDALAEYDFPVLQDQLAHGDQGTCVVLVDRNSERTFISQAGAERHFGSAQFGRIETAAFDFVLISGYTFAHSSHPDTLEAWVSEFPAGSKLIFDPSPVANQIPPNMLAGLLKRCAWISANANEAFTISGEDDPRKAAASLFDSMGERAVGVVVRIGAEGCWLATGGREPLHVPPFKVDPVDTNGAGDTHIGAFILALGGGLDPLSAARYANAAAALSTLTYGPATAPDNARTLAFMERHSAANRPSDPKILQSSKN